MVSKRKGPVSVLQIQPFPIGVGSDGQEWFRKLHPLLFVVAGAGDRDDGYVGQNGSNLGRVGNKVETQYGNMLLNSATAVRFYSFKSHSYVHVLRFRSVVRMIRCCSKIVAVGPATQIYCFDALTHENKFSVVTYAVPQLAGQGTIGVNVGYGPIAVGPRWLAHASNNPLPSKVGPEPNESGPGTRSASTLHMQEDEFRVKVEPIQWWDVCKRLEWPEKGDPCSNNFDRQDGTGRVQERMYSADGYGFNFLNITLNFILCYFVLNVVLL